MNKLIKFARLDFLASKSYFMKTTLMMAALAFGIGLLQRSAESLIAILGAYTMFFVIVPFSVGDKANLDALYSTLSISRSTVVAGRYTFIFFCQLAAIVASLAASLLLSALVNFPVDLGALMTGAVIIQVVLSLYMGIILPIFFKLGPTKARLFMVIPFVAISAVSPFAKRLVGNTSFMETIDSVSSFIKNQPVLAVIVALLFMLLFHVISASFSDRIYAKKEF